MASGNFKIFCTQCGKNRGVNPQSYKNIVDYSNCYYESCRPTVYLEVSCPCGAKIHIEGEETKYRYRIGGDRDPYDT